MYVYFIQHPFQSETKLETDFQNSYLINVNKLVFQLKQDSPHDHFYVNYIYYTCQ